MTILFNNSSLFSFRFSSEKDSIQNGGFCLEKNHHMIQSEKNNSSRLFKAIILGSVTTIFVLSTAVMMLYGFLITCRELHYENKRLTLGHATLGKFLSNLYLF